MVNPHSLVRHVWLLDRGKQAGTIETMALLETPLELTGPSVGLVEEFDFDQLEAEVLGGNDKALVVGDTHADLSWWNNAVMPTAEALNISVIIQLGDFGWWPSESPQEFVRTVANSEIPVMFLDGTWEHHKYLAQQTALARQQADIQNLSEPVRLMGNLFYLPRGGRTQVGNLRFCAVGGAVTPTRDLNKLNTEWFLEEEISDLDVNHAKAGGPADVFLCHDAPWGWDVPGFPPDLGDSQTLNETQQRECEGRKKLEEVLNFLKPAVVLHGRYHVSYSLSLTVSWGVISVEGLGCQGDWGSFRIVECGAQPWVSSLEGV